jgi:stearoyl-CoA desaturase (delta-9 desaturase)
MKCNSYEQYQRWGSIAHPLRTTVHYALNWAFWYGAFFLLGGHALATAIFGGAFVWAVGIRAHNYDLHAGGKDMRRDGIDFDRRNLSVNAFWPGMVAGEWHNNHHLFPNGIRSGFLPWQLDWSYLVILGFKALGALATSRDFKKQFYERHYNPYLAAKAAGGAVVAPSPPAAASVKAEASASDA